MNVQSGVNASLLTGCHVGPSSSSLSWKSCVGLMRIDSIEISCSSSSDLDGGCGACNSFTERPPVTVGLNFMDNFIRTFRSEVDSALSGRYSKAAHSTDSHRNSMESTQNQKDFRLLEVLQVMGDSGPSVAGCMDVWPCGLFV